MNLRWTTSVFDRPANVRRLLAAFFVALAGLLVADGFVHKHAYFDWADSPAFFAVFGFVACVAVIFGAKVLRFLLRRSENYYDDPAPSQTPGNGSDA